MKTFTEYRPAFVDGYENKEYIVNNILDVYDLEFVKRFSKYPDFHCFAHSGDRLMAMNKFQKETCRCSDWWIVGRLSGFTEEDFNEAYLLPFRLIKTEK